jgi:hypothetical protein
VRTTAVDGGHPVAGSSNDLSDGLFAVGLSETQGGFVHDVIDEPTPACPAPRPGEQRYRQATYGRGRCRGNRVRSTIAHDPIRF